MGANATTFVPSYTSGEVLTAANLSVTNSGIPVFADSTARDNSFGGTGEKVLAEGQYAYLESTNATQYYDGATWQSVGVSPGLVLVGLASPSAVSSVSIDNCFTSTYENYRILFSLTAMTGSQGNLTMRLRAAGSDSSTNYENQLTEFTGATVSTGADPVGTDEWFLATINSELAASFSMDIYRPQTAQKTAYNNSGLFMPGATTVQQQLTVGVQKDSTQFDGFTLLYSGTTFTGIVRVYGYANS